MYSTECRPVVLRDGGTEASETEAIDEDTDDLRRARFERAWRQNVSELYRRSLDWTSGRREDADDALGQAALVALEKMPQELQPDEARRWLLRLAFSKCMDIHRHRRRSRCVARVVDDPFLEEEIGAVGPGLESVLLAGELIVVARDRIQKLPPRLRTVAELHLLRDTPYSEIADLLSLTEVNVRKRMQEARALLREHLQAYLGGDVRIQAPRRLAAGGTSLTTDEPEPLRVSRWTLNSLEKYVQLHPRSWKRRWELAVRLRDAGSLNKAVFHFREAASRQPRRMEALVRSRHDAPSGGPQRRGSRGPRGGAAPGTGRGEPRAPAGADRTVPGVDRRTGRRLTARRGPPSASRLSSRFHIPPTSGVPGYVDSHPHRKPPVAWPGKWTTHRGKRGCKHQAPDAGARRQPSAMAGESRPTLNLTKPTY